MKSLRKFSIDDISNKVRKIIIGRGVVLMLLGNIFFEKSVIKSMFGLLLIDKKIRNSKIKSYHHIILF